MFYCLGCTVSEHQVPPNIRVFCSDENAISETNEGVSTMVTFKCLCVMSCDLCQWNPLVIFAVAIEEYNSS